MSQAEDVKTWLVAVAPGPHSALVPGSGDQCFPQSRSVAHTNMFSLCCRRGSASTDERSSSEELKSELTVEFALAEMKNREIRG